MHYYKGIDESSKSQLTKLHYIHPHEIFVKDNITCCTEFNDPWYARNKSPNDHYFQIYECAKDQTNKLWELADKDDYKLSRRVYPYVRLMSINTLDFKSIELQVNGVTIETLTPELIKPMLELYSLPEKYHDFYVIPFWMSLFGIGYVSQYHHACVYVNGTQKYELKYQFNLGINDTEFSIFTPLLKLTKKAPESQLICAVISKEYDEDEYIFNPDSLDFDNKKTDETIVVRRTKKIDEWSIYPVINPCKLKSEYCKLYDFKTHNNVSSLHFKPDDRMYYLVPYKYGYISGLCAVYPMSRSFRISKEEEDHITNRDNEENA